LVNLGRKKIEITLSIFTILKGLTTIGQYFVNHPESRLGKFGKFSIELNRLNVYIFEIIISHLMLFVKNY